jgi:amino acid permease
MSMLRHDEAEEAESLLKRAQSGNSLTASFILMVSFMLGSGFLTQAYVFKESGVAVAPVLYVVAVIGSYAGCTYLLDVMGNRRVFDYALVAGDILGDVGWLAVHIGIIVQNVGCIISYFILLGDMLQLVIITFAGGDSEWYTDLFFLTGLCIVVLSPMTAVHQFSEMVWLAIITFVMLSVSFFFVIVDGSMTASIYEDLSINIASGSGVVETVGFVLFALGMNVIVPTTYVNSENSDRHTFDKVLLGSNLLGGGMLFTVGIVGYLSFRSDTQVNIMDNFAGTTASILKCVVMAHLLTYIPGCTVVTRNSLYALVGVSVNDESFVSLLGIGGLILTVIGFVSVVLAEYYGTSTALSNVINITGGVSSSFLSFGMPGILALKCDVTNSDSYTFYVSWALILFSIATTLMVFLGIFLE